MRKSDKDKLLNKTEIRRRGWDGEKIRFFLPKPIYKGGVPMWKLRDVETAEASLEFYLPEVEQ